MYFFFPSDQVDRYRVSATLECYPIPTLYLTAKTAGKCVLSNFFYLPYTNLPYTYPIGRNVLPHCARHTRPRAESFCTRILLNSLCRLVVVSLPYGHFFVRLCGEFSLVPVITNSACTK